MTLMEQKFYSKPKLKRHQDNYTLFIIPDNTLKVHICRTHEYHGISYDFNLAVLYSK
jgi:hypothetical protein